MLKVEGVGHPLWRGGLTGVVLGFDSGDLGQGGERAAGLRDPFRSLVAWLLLCSLFGQRRGH